MRVQIFQKCQLFPPDSATPSSLTTSKNQFCENPRKEKCQGNVLLNSANEKDSGPQKKRRGAPISCESGEENAKTLQHILEKSPCFAGLLSTFKVTRVRSWGRFARENTCFFHVFLFHTVFCEVFLAPFSRSFHVRFSPGSSGPDPAETPPKKALSTRKETLPPPRSRVQGSRGLGVQGLRGLGV